MGRVLQIRDLATGLGSDPLVIDSVDVFENWSLTTTGITAILEALCPPAPLCVQVRKLF